MAPECDKPINVTEMWWGVLDKGHCLQGNIHYYEDYKNTSYSYTPMNDTGRETEKKEKDINFLKRYELPLSTVLLMFGTTGNIIIIFIISCKKDMRTVPNMYILNLAVSNIILLTAISYYVWKYCNPCPSDFVTCSFIPFCYRMSISLTAYSIAVLSLQRYRVTVNPLSVRVSSQPTWRSTGVTIFAVWIVAALCAVPAARSRNVCSVTVLGMENYYQYVLIFNLLVSAVIPLCIIAFSYIMTACHPAKNSYSVSERIKSPQLNKRKKTAKVVLGLTAVFLISYVPYHIWITYLYFSIASDISGDNLFWANNLRDVYTTLYLLLLINSSLNPVALLCTSRAFRKQLKRYLTCCCKANSSPTVYELRRIN